MLASVTVVQWNLHTYLPPSVRMIGLPVLVMAISERRRFGATLLTMFRAERAATRDETILAVIYFDARMAVISQPISMISSILWSNPGFAECIDRASQRSQRTITCTIT